MIRNALAVTGDDEHRHLAADGRQIARGVGARLSKEQVEIDAMVTSPLARAVQTAELIAERIDYLGAIETRRSLLPGSRPQVIAEQIVGIGGNVAVVGHEPTISQLCAFMCGLPGFAPFRHAQVSLLADNRPVWKLLPHTLEIEILNAPEP